MIGSQLLKFHGGLQGNDKGETKGIKESRFFERANFYHIRSTWNSHNKL